MKPFLHVSLLCIVMIISGCWDRTEINDLAFISGAAFDLNKDGSYILSLQIAIPASGQGGPGSGGSSVNEKFFVISASGKNANEAFAKLQKKSSRRLFTAHRGVIFIGETLAKSGIKDILDVYIHDPRQRLKTYIMVVKGGEGREILQSKYPFEQVPIEAIKEMENLQSELAVTLRDFFIAASSEGISPVMGVIETEGSADGSIENKNQLFKLAGSAIFKDLKLVGYLNDKETSGFNWLTNKMKHGRVNANLPDDAGNVGMLLNHAKRRMTIEINGSHIKVAIHLTGEGSLVENNSILDVTQPSNLELVQNALEVSVEQQVQDALAKVQKRYQVDSMGFGRELFRDHPDDWKALREKWEEQFPLVDVSVDVKLLVETGMAGPPLHVKEMEIMK